MLFSVVPVKDGKQFSEKRKNGKQKAYMQRSARAGLSNAAGFVCSRYLVVFIVTGSSHMYENPFVRLLA